MENFIFCAVMFPLKSNSNSNIMDLKASIPETEPESASESKSECVFDFDIKKQQNIVEEYNMVMVSKYYHSSV